MKKAERALLLNLADTHNRGGFAMACDGPDRTHAHSLDKQGFAEWRGTNWGSSFWSITEAGLKEVAT
jgi:hypothetical protein